MFSFVFLLRLLRLISLSRSFSFQIIIITAAAAPQSNRPCWRAYTTRERIYHREIERARTVFRGWGCCWYYFYYLGLSRLYDGLGCRQLLFWSTTVQAAYYTDCDEFFIRSIVLSLYYVPPGEVHIYYSPFGSLHTLNRANLDDVATWKLQ